MRTKSFIKLFSFLALILASALAQDTTQPATKTSPKTKAPGKAGAVPQKNAAPGLTDEQRAARTVEATMDWDKSSSAGVKVSTELIKKAEVKGHHAFEYRLKVAGVPHNQSYKLMVWPVTTAVPIVMMDGLAVANDGTVGCPATSTGTCAQRIKGAELILPYVPEKGEIYRHALISQDNKARAFFSIIPDPMVQTDKGCTLEVIRLSPNFELVAVGGKGYEAGSDVIFHTQSFQEEHTVPVQADKSGQFHAELTPFVKGRTSGTIEVNATSNRCAPRLSFEWGKPQP